MKNNLNFLQNGTRNFTDIKNKLEPLLRDAFAETANDTNRIRILNSIKMAIAHEATLDSQISYHRKDFRISNQEVDWLLKHNQANWIDYLVHRYEFTMYPSEKKLKNFPLHLLIEPTAACNLRCVMCFQLDEAFRKKEMMGMMSWDLFKKIVDEAKENNCNAITLASRGEPTLHKQLGDMLLYIAEKKIMEVKLNTNATRLTEELCHKILESGVNSLVFSVDASTKETYESIRVRGKFEQVVENISRFKRIRDSQYPNSPTVTRISGVKVNSNQNMDQMFSFWSQYVDDVAIVDCIPRWESYGNEKNNILEPCTVFWERLYVWYDGQVNPCDFDYKSFLSPGNANTTTIADLWLGDNLSKIRDKHLNKQRSKCFPCDRCPL